MAALASDDTEAEVSFRPAVLYRAMEAEASKQWQRRELHRLVRYSSERQVLVTFG